MQWIHRQITFATSAGKGFHWLALNVNLSFCQTINSAANAAIKLSWPLFRNSSNQKKSPFPHRTANASRYRLPFPICPTLVPWRRSLIPKRPIFEMHRIRWKALIKIFIYFIDHFPYNLTRMVFLVIIHWHNNPPQGYVPIKKPEPKDSGSLTKAIKPLAHLYSGASNLSNSPL